MAVNVNETRSNPALHGLVIRQNLDNATILHNQAGTKRVTVSVQYLPD